MSNSIEAEGPRVLSVGQCNLDHGTLSRLLSSRFGARVDRAHGLDDARQALDQADYALVLVNRQLDADGSPGVDVIKAVKADPKVGAVPMMLVSDFADAQQAAEEVGARPGFGKSALQAEETLARLAAVLG